MGSMEDVVADRCREENNKWSSSGAFRHFSLLLERERAADVCENADDMRPTFLAADQLIRREPIVKRARSAEPSNIFVIGKMLSLYDDDAALQIYHAKTRVVSSIL